MRWSNIEKICPVSLRRGVSWFPDMMMRGMLAFSRRRSWCIAKVMVRLVGLTESNRSPA